ncbi:HAMP domain-containing histidine kinase [Aestuariicella hydrocarbonica]|uniref:histidine kinase n=1 Tax=Pseudomaricurvus hydrocarbonicus TaxID=1470433 RepID=A0A9E5MP99_9GAMM|nr:HAMP domain-containing sensor histidine kinase [Aestuariicella hydrocarbonica]NHO67844.1 HAMP domain-containing histidine kinase [Aestuariicella hydrocarbonica]
MATYSVVTTEYFIRGLDSSLMFNMERVARVYRKWIPQEDYAKGTDFINFFLSSNWDTMPEYVHQVFDNPPDEHSRLLKHSNSGWFDPPSEIVFLMSYEDEQGTLYISQLMRPDYKSSVVDATHKQNKQLWLLVSFLVMAFVALICWLLLRHISRPIAALRTWTHSLDSDKLSQPLPDFSYPELNEMAELIRNSLSSVQQALEREHRFLRYASHELRTPISTIRSNIELYQKLSLKQQRPASEQAVLDRIDRASKTMKYLTETLLWLNHEPDSPLRTQLVNLPDLVQELASEMEYLLTGKPVDVEIKTHPFECNIPMIPARIIIGNLIRNAYQHCWEGRVLIEQQNGCISISNPVGSDELAGDSLNQQSGYGLGLELTHQLTQRMRWTCQHQIEDNRYWVELIIAPSD